jgi:hypothetical protein
VRLVSRLSVFKRCQALTPSTSMVVVTMAAGNDVEERADQCAVGHDGPEVGHDGPVALNFVAHRVLHPGVGGQNEEGREHRPALTIQIDARWMRAETRSLPKIQMPRKVDSKKKANRASMASGAPNTLPDIPRVVRPVHAELELLDDAGDHADGEVDEKEPAPEDSPSSSTCQVLDRVVPVLVGRRLHDRQQQGQPDRQGDENEVKDGRDPELPPRQVECRHADTKDWSPTRQARSTAPVVRRMVNRTTATNSTRGFLPSHGPPSLTLNALAIEGGLTLHL